MLDLKAYFKSVPYKYCILRRPEAFPEYKVGSDLDILCLDRNEAATHALHFVYPLTGSYHAISKLTRSGHRHVDLRKGRKLIFRFDFIDSLQIYKKFNVSSVLKGVVLASRELKNGAYVPNYILDLVLRHMEYVERPKKVQHRYQPFNEEIDLEFSRILKKYTSLKL